MPANMLQNPGLVPTYVGVTLSAGASVRSDEDGTRFVAFTSEGEGAMGNQRAVFALDPTLFPDGTEVGRTYRAEIDLRALSDGAAVQLSVGAVEPLNITEAGPVVFDFTAATSVSGIRVAHGGSGPIEAEFSLPLLTD